MKLFGTDGVRGRAGEKLNAMTAMRLAMAAGIYFRKNSITNKILVGKDTRKSGYMIETSIVAGLTAVGYNVIQIGPMPTPAIAFLTEDMRCDAGIMISASHNPFDDNGIKFFDSFGNKLNVEAEKAIEDIFYNDEMINANQKTGLEIGQSKRIDDVIGRYIVHIKNSFPAKLTLKGLRVVLDVANGAVYKVAPTVFSELGAEIIVLNDEPNGGNINLNCGALHPENLAKEVKHLRADIGFAFDGDADRLVVVDENGRVVDGDALLGILATYLDENKMLDKKEIVATVMSNAALDDYLAKHKIKLLRSNVGDKFVLEMMKENGINFGGEQSGHIIFSDFSKTGDGLVSALQVSACLLAKSKKASEIFGVIKPYPQKLLNLKVADKKSLDSIKGLKELEDELKKIGIRTLFRYSGTENVIRLLLEGRDEALVTKKMSEVEKFFTKALNE
ncbi:phosphoglucosamine mutase [Campylobacter hyointestinalis]|uniref:Phosphoglucosamine mutase n=1 Tax=Campylobacter hyointestinalis subsp. hyointestinalis TaxID=91352 RepID=A0A855N3C9_CAMHY|nr:phosphoglucosamine mutase [Campylobacter hyointestinalis]ANE33298.1 phosphoglucosamine mutase [Campylobacter hyointestinalis subsp. hyointestinalis LMG 9260]KEA44646.1 phosphoglucosamine mutase [Campylobacter hyointestinalis subsp. hyointestinalis]MBT0611402.1 phosphoglucosamine mutase [Campylobacter hyointestinalis subsp. hyointestinalis]MDL2346245.1 phosphoglucosamine mutase [Campylobacter hyointestinalis]MDL2347985.1 phosphoglucosamine mutase [Campylobacter hyointestinalis]